MAMTPSDHDGLVRRAKAGDRYAFDELVGPLVNHAFRLAYGMLHDREAAEDAVQEAALRAWRKLGNLRPGTPMRPWFLAIVANQCRTTARGRWRSVIRLAAPSTPGMPDFQDEFVRGAELRAALRKLSQDHREALVLRFYLDLSVEEVAAITGVAVGTVKSRLNRGMAAMRPYFQPEEALI
jgi:RNA polymerase sigma-70 factor, ECF subfamily